jgi:hypothetical protein
MLGVMPTGLPACTLPTHNRLVVSIIVVNSFDFIWVLLGDFYNFEKNICLQILVTIGLFLFLFLFTFLVLFAAGNDHIALLPRFAGRLETVQW